MTIQERVRQRMEQMGWSEYKLAKMADVSQSTISHMFRRNNAPSYTTIEAICNAFGITVAQFFAEEGEAVVLTSEQIKTLTLWGTLSPEQKRIIYDTMLEFSQEKE